MRDIWIDDWIYKMRRDIALSLGLVRRKPSKFSQAKWLPGCPRLRCFSHFVLDFNATPPKTNMNPRNDGLEEEFPASIMGIFFLSSR